MKSYNIGGEKYTVINGVREYALATAVTANSTTTTAPAGSLGRTSHATGANILFVSDGSKWQLQSVDVTIQVESATIPTAAGATDKYFTAPFAAVLTAAQVTPLVALAANDTNYLTFSVTNLGQAGAGSTALLAAVDANTTKLTGGTALGVNTRRDLTVHGTVGNLVVAKGDRIKITATGTGTLANTVTVPVYLLTFRRSA